MRFRTTPRCLHVWRRAYERSPEPPHVHQTNLTCMRESECIYLYGRGVVASNVPRRRQAKNDMTTKALRFNKQVHAQKCIAIGARALIVEARCLRFILRSGRGTNERTTDASSVPVLAACDFLSVIWRFWSSLVFHALAAQHACRRSGRTSSRASRPRQHCRVCVLCKMPTSMWTDTCMSVCV